MTFEILREIAAAPLLLLLLLLLLLPLLLPLLLLLLLEIENSGNIFKLSILGKILFLHMCKWRLVGIVVRCSLEWKYLLGRRRWRRRRRPRRWSFWEHFLIQNF